MNEQKPQRSWIRKHPIWTVIIAIVGVFVVMLLYAWFMPFFVDAPASDPAQYLRGCRRPDRGDSGG